MGQSSSTPRSSSVTNFDGRIPVASTPSRDDATEPTSTNDPLSTTSPSEAFPGPSSQTLAVAATNRREKRRFVDLMTPGARAETSSYGEGMTKKRWRPFRRGPSISSSSSTQAMGASLPLADPEHSSHLTAPETEAEMAPHDHFGPLDSTIASSLFADSRMQTINNDDLDVADFSNEQHLDSVMDLRSQPDSSVASASSPSPAITQLPPLSSEHVARESDPSRAVPTPTPGTLVIVQGIVQTGPTLTGGGTSNTAASMRGDPRPRSVSQGASRGRLSELLRPTMPSFAQPLHSPQPFAYDSPPLPSSGSAPVALAQPSVAIHQTGQDITPSAPASASVAPDALASNSIDVLGALLGFVAASTAASLLTGATMPFSPTPSPQVAPPSATGPPAAHPLFETPDTSLSADATRLRLRNAWSSVRDRIAGLGNNGSHGTTPSSSALNSGIESPRNLSDTHRMLLDELERVRELGRDVGVTPRTRPADVSPAAANPSSLPRTLNDDSRGTSAARSEPASMDIPLRLPTSRDVPSAAGTFERFLFDLQVELRERLSESPTNDAMSSPQESSTDPSSTIPMLNTSDFNTSPSTEPPLSHEHSNSVQDALDHHSVVDVTLLPSTSAQALEDVSIEPLSVAGDNRDAAPANAVPRGEINWWRMYRFPAMQVDNSRGVPVFDPPNTPAASRSISDDHAPMLAVPSTLSPTSTSINVSASSAESSVPVESVVESVIPRDGTFPGEVHVPLDSPPVASPRSYMVPVIVIGLQSVPLAVGPSTVDDRNPLVDHLPTSSNESSPEEPSVAAERPMPWTSRAAAAAMRNLRISPRRRAAPHSDQTIPPNSSMFLIYVIGGYYPPDHHILNSPDSLNLGALWDIAELLSSIKSETVTRTDIEQSGLRVIKPSELVKLEEEGQVSNSCVDRCLICLDDYEPEANVRLLNCQHAFHQDCVDTWLSTGKNNCPACRTTGVVNTGRPSTDAV